MVAGTMKDVVIHFGVHKTGTSSIQRRLSENRQTLAASGILYPDIRRKANHFDLYTCFHERPLEYRMVKVRGITGADEIEKLRGEIKRALESQLAASGAERLILSSEAFSMMNAHELRQFIAYIASFGFERMQCVVYLRDYITYWESELQQKIKGGIHIDVMAEEQKLEMVRTYRRFLETLSECVGRDAIRIRLFHRPLLKDGDAVADFLALAEIDVIKSSGSIFNESLSRGAMVALNELNKRISRIAIRDNAAVMLRSVGGPKYIAGPAVMQRILDRTTKDRAYLSHEWFSGRDWLAEIMQEVAANPARLGPDDNRHPGFDEVMDAVAVLYENLQRDAAEQGAERWLAAARLAELRGQDRRAQRAMEHYRIMRARIQAAADLAWEAGGGPEETAADPLRN
jgi:hypothetical protein